MNANIEAKYKDLVAELANKCRSRIDAELVEDMVIGLKEAEASEILNAGLAAQIGYLLEAMGPADTLDLLLGRWERSDEQCRP